MRATFGKTDIYKQNFKNTIKYSDFVEQEIKNENTRSIYKKLY